MLVTLLQNHHWLIHISIEPLSEKYKPMFHSLSLLATSQISSFAFQSCTFNLNKPTMSCSQHAACFWPWRYTVCLPSLHLHTVLTQVCVCFIIYFHLEVFSPLSSLLYREILSTFVSLFFALLTLCSFSGPLSSNQWEGRLYLFKNAFIYFQKAQWQKKKKWFIYRENERRKRVRETDLPSIGSVPRWLQQSASG